MYGRERSSGFTMIELLITMAIMAIILGLVVPSFQGIIRSNQVTTEANAFMSAVQLARSEAVKRGNDVSLSADGAGFGDGWCVHTGANCAADLIREFDEPSSDFAAGFTSVTFNRRGERDTGPAMLQVQVRPADCDAGEAGAEREISILVSGQVRMGRNDCP
ncbi:GspH/FimT family pseudopilin [Marinobacter zhanjiangensis]|uniref:Type II secretion system protein H n=1 Tax=Marinobacter zhanjiangensis TaxID=578215 RepID=A0ABQ3B5N1_9GAMM|nr:GspH/FimT family pseudopilin [Marinobacter zhanjiangensis]GGY79549.1 pre-pilin like leader sequence [Marinobacter zhanjiangensis]